MARCARKMLPKHVPSGFIALAVAVGSGLRGASGFQFPKIVAPRELFASSKKATLPPLMSTTAPADLGAVSEVEPSKKEEVFNWNKQWYPVLSLRDTDPGRAHAVQLLGKDLVVWRDKEERWSCFDDRCPHRAAPLTEGRVESDGSLLCAYHAWRFDADGKCLSIPQSDRGGKDEAQPKACAKVYPTQVAQDIIWVWGENGPDAALESALTPAHLVPELEDKEGLKSGKVQLANIGMNEVSYGWDTLMENLVDPSHVPVSHHGIAGDRYTSPRPIDMEPTERWPAVTKEGFEFEYLGNSKATFYPPCLVRRIVNQVDDAFGKFFLILYGTPTKPGWSRLIGRQAYVHRFTPKTKESQKLIKKAKTAGEKKSEMQQAFSLTLFLPSWVQHVSGHLFLNQDMVFLHHQEKILTSAGYDSSTYGNAVFVPTKADRAVVALRKWITDFGSGGPAWDKGCDPTLPPREHNRDVLFNVYESHTKKCSSCSGALKNVKKLLTAAKTSAALSFAWTLLRGARAVTATATSRSSPVLNAVTARAMLPTVVLTLASLGAVKALEKLHGMFYSYSFHHQDSP
ncbi:unnamed protein product [Scytosiphon promiscuus]